MNATPSPLSRRALRGLSRQRGYSLIELAIALAILSVIIVASLIGVQRILANNRANNTLRQVPVINAAITAGSVNATNLSAITTAQAAGLGAFPNWDGTNAINEFGGRYYVAGLNAAAGSTPVGQGYFLYITNVPQSMCPTIANGVGPIAKGVYVVDNVTSEPAARAVPAASTTTGTTTTPNPAVVKNGAIENDTVSFANIAASCSSRSTATVMAFISRTSF